MNADNLQIQTGDRVVLHYTTYSQDDCLIETSRNREPLEFVVGTSEIVAGLQRAVLGLAEGQTHRFPVMPELAFGLRQSRLQPTVPRCGLPDNVQEGVQLQTQPAESGLDVWIKQLREHEMILDANHPLAGETLLYDVEILSIQRPPSLETV
ncbi:peptidylprolyl isomerase [bacterium]|nr:peptidylprolyl isomerase [bacterium]